ncbi:unnamed protein product [Danaus chrysippus]|uniref:(African queen) hypothetical protein n=1 Tax=Danaus chrysippus TaxID=151541 RepID=A0A8J2W7I8_9NEOP|nr:unnamed protein product [Danaus chrysippus]
MRAIKLLTFYFLIWNPVRMQEITEESRLIKVCSYCTCSEIPEVDGTHLVLNILCSELDRIENLADLDKIQWPENPNGLKISATFEGMGLSTLGKLPPNSQVETLRFTNNAIKTYWPDPFSDVPNLKRISFTQNELSEITPDLFTKIESLEDLDLSYNKIGDINPLDFKFLHNLKRLNLQSNLLKKIPVASLEPMTLLEDLDLSKNGIQEVLLRRVESVTLKGIKRLNLNSNRIRSILKESFPENNSIELLDLSNNIIEMVEEDALSSCINLRELNLAQNNITFPFAVPPTLQIAILKINTLYHWLNFPASITYIDLSYNRLSALYNEETVDFNNLEVLSIGGNQLRDFDIQRKLPKLFSLDISYNLLQEVPKCLSSEILPNLEELRLDGNPMDSIYFKNIIALKYLYMNDLIKLTVVDDKAFSNVIGRRGEDDVNSEKSCFSLYLSHNPSLSNIQDGAFDGTNVCMLDISHNNLSVLSRSVISPPPSEGVDLQYNPWRCSCEMQWIVDDLLPVLYRDSPRLLDELRCGSPRAHEGLRLVHWYNWTGRALCDQKSLGNYEIESSTEPSKVTNLTLILGGCIIVALLIAIALFVYLVKSRRRHRIRQAALNRKSQSSSDAKNTNGLHNEFAALNKT